MEIYMDAEFDAVRKGGRFHQCLISIGMIAIEAECVIDSYYSLIHPKHFHALTRTVKRITKLTDEEIRSAPGFRKVMDEVNAFFNRFHNQYQLYTFGPDDVRTLKQQAEFEGYDKTQAFTEFIDLQKIISSKICYDGQMISAALSLDDLKYIYGLNNKVEHNALNDAADLYLIHEAYRRRALQSDRVKIIAERKQQKQADVKKRRLIHTQNILFERYHFFEHQKGRCSLYPDVLHQLECLQERGCLRLPHTVSAMMIRRNYEQGHLTMEWLMHPYPLIELSLFLQEEQWHQKCPLTYGNAGIFEQIWKLCEKDILHNAS